MQPSSDISFRLTAAIGLALAGCATKWTKPGATEQEFEVTKASCIGRASSRFPPAMQHIQIGSGYTTPMQTQCFGTGYSVNCTTTGGQYVPPAFMDVDANTGARNSDVRSCFFENGWTPETSEQAQSRPVSGGSGSDISAQLEAGSACTAAGIKPDDPGYFQCFQTHLPH